MRELRTWWGQTQKTGGTVLLVARDTTTAAKLVGLPRSDLPFHFRERTGVLGCGLTRGGVYRDRGLGAWVRDEPAKDLPDLEDA